MQSETCFPSSHQLKSYVASKSRLKLAARAVLSADAGLLVTSGIRPSTHRLNRQSPTAACFMHVHKQARTFCTHRCRTSTQPATSKFQISSRKKANFVRDLRRIAEQKQGNAAESRRRIMSAVVRRDEGSAIVLCLTMFSDRQSSGTTDGNNIPYCLLTAPGDNRRPAIFVW